MGHHVGNITVLIDQLRKDRYDLRVCRLTRDQAIMLAEIIEVGDEYFDFDDVRHYEGDEAQSIIDRATLLRVSRCLLEEVQS